MRSERNGIKLTSAMLVAMVAMPAAARAGVWSLEPAPMPLPRRVELAFGLELRQLDPWTLPADRQTDPRKPAAGGKDDTDPEHASVVAVFLHSSAEAARGVYLGLNLELGSASGDRHDGSVYWGAGAVISAVPTRGVVVLRAELLAGLRGLSVPVSGSRAGRWDTRTHAAVEPRLALELTLDAHWSLGVHAGAELLPHRTPVIGVYILHRGRAASADLLQGGEQTRPSTI